MKKLRLLLSMVTATAVLFTACQPGGETPEDPNPGQGTETPENPGSGETPDTPDTPVTPETKVIVFTGEYQMGNCEYEPGMNLLMAVGLPGHWLKLKSEDVQATLFMTDFSGDIYSYSYLKAGHYPMAAGSFDNMTWPTTSALVAMEADYCNFYVFSEDMMYTPVVPESATDADGELYGVKIEASPAETGQDLSYLIFNIPVVDENGKPAVVKGYYYGPLGYEGLGGGAGGGQQTEALDLTEWNFTKFTANYNDEFKVLTLECVYSNDKLTLSFRLEETGGKFAGQHRGTVGGSLVRYGMAGADDEVYELTDGYALVETTDTPGVYTLTLSDNSPLVFWSQGLEYHCTGTHTITVEGLPEGL